MDFALIRNGILLGLLICNKLKISSDILSTLSYLRMIPWSRKLIASMIIDLSFRSSLWTSCCYVWNTLRLYSK